MRVFFQIIIVVQTIFLFFYLLEKHITTRKADKEKRVRQIKREPRERVGVRLEEDETLNGGRHSHR